MILISGTIDIDPGRRDVAVAAAQDLMAATRTEEGCLQYVFSADLADDGRFYVNERWATAEAADRHMQAEHLVTFLGRLGEFGVRGAELRRWESDDGTPLF